MSHQEDREPNNISQTGSAGKDLFQIGRDYIKYIRVHIAAGDWGIVIFNLILISIFIYGLGHGTKLISEKVISKISSATQKYSEPDIKPSSKDSSMSTTDPAAVPASPSVSSNPFESALFPQDSCGDQQPDNPNDYPVSFYPVYVDYSENILNTVRSNFCEDSRKVFREKVNKDMIIVASFTDLKRAQQFKNFMISKLGSGDIGEPSLIREPLNSSSKSGGNSDSTTSSEKSIFGFDEVSFDCSNYSKDLVVKYVDLELTLRCISHILGHKHNFSGVSLGILANNYSHDWYEVISEKGSIELINPGGSIEISGAKQEDKKIFAKKYSNSPTRKVTINCSDQPLNIWKLEMTPRCTSSGTYVDLQINNSILSTLPYEIVIELPNGKRGFYRDDIGSNSSGSLTSSNRQISFTMWVRY